MVFHRAAWFITRPNHGSHLPSTIELKTTPYKKELKSYENKHTLLLSNNTWNEAAQLLPRRLPSPERERERDMGTSVQVTPLCGVYNENPLSYLVSIDGFNFLIDCGWHDHFDPTILQPLSKYSLLFLFLFLSLSIGAALCAWNCLT